MLATPIIPGASYDVAGRIILADHPCLAIVKFLQELPVNRAFCDGNKAAKEGRALTTNPYPAGTDQRSAWTSGYFTVPYDWDANSEVSYALRG